MRRGAFRIVSRHGLTWLECTRLARLSWLVHAFSTRIGGVSEAPAAGLNLGTTKWDRPSNVEANRKLFLRALDAEQFSLAAVHQIHSARIYSAFRGQDGVVEYRPCDPSPPRRSAATPREGDALLTDEPGVLLSVRSADCMPVLLVDQRQRALAAVHSGWRGAVAGIVGKAVAEMGRCFASRPRDLVAAIGPFIHPCCYAVGEEVAEAFRGRFAESKKFFRSSALAPTRAAAYLDLGAVARHELRCSGVLASNIQVTNLCTACHSDLFFSHRKEGAQTGRMMAVVGLRARGAQKRG